MSWYQAISLLAALYFSWNLLPPAFALFNGHQYSVSWLERLFFTALFMNLALAFLGEPW
jgi:hypothetical protein